MRVEYIIISIILMLIVLFVVLMFGKDIIPGLSEALENLLGILPSE